MSDMSKMSLTFLLTRISPSVGSEARKGPQHARTGFSAIPAYVGAPMQPDASVAFGEAFPAASVIAAAMLRDANRAKVVRALAVAVEGGDL